MRNKKHAYYVVLSTEVDNKEIRFKRYVYADKKLNKSLRISALTENLKKELELDNLMIEYLLYLGKEKV